MSTTATAFESWEDKGIVGIHSSRGKVIVSDNVTDLLSFLRYSVKDTLRVAFDLDEFIAPILRLLPRDTLERLAGLDEHLFYGEHPLFYFPGVMAGIGHSRFYGMKQFLNQPGFPPTPPLSDVQSTADEIMATLPLLDVNDPYSLASAIDTFSKSETGKRLLESIPRAKDLPASWDVVSDFASPADRKDWVENRQVGHFAAGEAWDFDISACYSSLAAKLVDLRDCDLWHSDSLSKRDLGAVHGLVRGSFLIYPESEYAHCSPIMSDVGNGLLGNPVGELPEDTYSMEEVRTVEKYGIGEFAFKEGWFFQPTNGVRARYPFKAVMEHLYLKRQRSDMSASIVKAVANSIVGKLIQVNRRTGDLGELWNVIYHVLITAGARCRITEFLVNNEVKSDDIISVQTDGVRLTRLVPTPAHNGMGTWRCNGTAPLLVVSPRKVYTEDKRPYRVTYDGILNAVAEHPMYERYYQPAKHRLTLPQARDAGDIFRVGEVIDAPAILDLIGLEREQTRVFPKLPHTGKALLSNKYMSEPVVIGGI